MKSFKEMVAERNALREREKEVGYQRLSLEEQINLDFLEQKIDDLTSDIDFWPHGG